MNIDSHQHFWRYDAARDTWITDAMQAIKRDFLPPDLAAEMNANRIDASIAVQTAQSEDDTRFLLDLAEEDKRIAGVVGWVDLQSPELEQRLKYFSKYRKLRGFRHVAQAEPDNRFLVRPEFAAGIARLKEFGFTYDILIFPRQLPAAIELVSMFPEQRFVVDHMAKPDVRTRTSTRWSMLMCKLASKPNVSCKLSGLVTEADWYRWSAADFAPFLDTVFQAFGPERLMFGSDWPVCLLAATYAKVKGVLEEYVDRNAAEHKEKIFGGNAIRFYGLEEFTRGFAAQG
jgi:L-fuconolactonase